MTLPAVPNPARFPDEQLVRASPDLLRQMLTTFLNTGISAQADAVCGADHGARLSERGNTRNGYRSREFDTRAAPWTLRTQSCAPGPASQTGCSSSADGERAPTTVAARTDRIAEEGSELPV
jgi:hypothetical protein